MSNVLTRERFAKAGVTHGFSGYLKKFPDGMHPGTFNGGLVKPAITSGIDFWDVVESIDEEAKRSKMVSKRAVDRKISELHPVQKTEKDSDPEPFVLPFSQDDVDHIEHLFKGGMEIEEIAYCFECSYSRINSVLDKNGFKAAHEVERRDRRKIKNFGLRDLWIRHKSVRRISVEAVCSTKHAIKLVRMMGFGDQL